MPRRHLADGPDMVDEALHAIGPEGQNHQGEEGNIPHRVEEKDCPRRCQEQVGWSGVLGPASDHQSAQQEGQNRHGGQGVKVGRLPLVEISLGHRAEQEMQGIEVEAPSVGVDHGGQG